MTPLRLFSLPSLALQFETIQLSVPGPLKPFSFGERVISASLATERNPVSVVFADCLKKFSVVAAAPEKVHHPLNPAGPLRTRRGGACLKKANY